jgi:hypothetical protein
MTTSSVINYYEQHSWSSRAKYPGTALLPAAPGNCVADADLNLGLAKLLPRCQGIDRSIRDRVSLEARMARNPGRVAIIRTKTTALLSRQHHCAKSRKPCLPRPKGTIVSVRRDDESLVLLSSSSATVGNLAPYQSKCTPSQPFATAALNPIQSPTFISPLLSALSEKSSGSPKVSESESR